MRPGHCCANRLFTELASDIALHDTATRLAHALSRRARDDPKLCVDETHRELAALIAASQSEVTRGLASIERRGLIERKRYRSGITVLDVDALERYESRFR